MARTCFHDAMFVVYNVCLLRTHLRNEYIQVHHLHTHMLTSLLFFFFAFSLPFYLVVCFLEIFCDF